MALTEDSAQFFKEVLDKTMPNPDRPKLPPEMEEKFTDLDARSAACYAELEIDTERIRQMAASLSNLAKTIDETPDPDLSDGSVGEELFDSTSTVYHIEELKSKIKAGVG